MLLVRGRSAVSAAFERRPAAGEPLPGQSLMGLPKLHSIEPPKKRALRMHIESIRRKEPQLDRDGEWFERCVELAREVGADAEAVFEEWNERAAVRMYLGELELDAAEAAAFEDVKERLCGR